MKCTSPKSLVCDNGQDQLQLCKESIIDRGRARPVAALDGKND